MLVEIVAAVFVVLLCVFYWLPWLLDDLTLLRNILPVQARLLRLVHKHKLFISLFEANASRFHDRTLLIFNDRKYTFEEMNRMMTKVANAALGLGLKSNDCVSLLMYNSPDLLWITYGLFKVGIRVALLNTNVREQQLVHCVRESGASVLIFGQDEDLVDSVNEISCDLNDVALWVNSRSDDVIKMIDVPLCLGDYIDSANGDNFEKATRDGTNCCVGGTVGYIFTSGTTGLSKPVRLSNLRLFTAACIPNLCRTLSTNDVIYAPLPLYHSLGFCAAFGAAVMFGCTLLTRKKFSASTYWSDCHTHKVTVALYIGEMWRYLVHQPENPNVEKNHGVKIAVGNGLREDIWPLVRERFDIPQIQEFFAASEGNTGFFNANNTRGSVGRLSPLTSFLQKSYLMKYDNEKGVPRRDERGHCIPAEIGEPGLLITKVTKVSPFDGYHGTRANELNSKKLLKHAFSDSDDLYFNFGDLLYCDDRYNLYFADRTGDTFRWKSENVSTTEVASSLCLVDWIRNVAVYGVSVPDCEGRAGMAAIHTKSSDKFMDADHCHALYKHCHLHLPSYARPLFVRIVTDLDVTGTFKVKKTTLVEEGFNPSKVLDSLYFRDDVKKTYVPLNERLFSYICSGEVRL